MTYEDKCPIWGTPATFETTGGDRLIVSSARAGGAYEITGTARAKLASYTDQFPSAVKAKISTWLVNERRNGVERPLVTDQVLESLMVARSLGIVDRRDRLLQYVANRCPLLGDGIVTSSQEANWPKTQAELQAWTESVNDKEVGNLLLYCKQEGFLIDKPDRIRLTFKGHEYLEKVRQYLPQSKQAFVAMWFNQEVQAAYDKGIKPAIVDSGYEAMRIDGKEHANKIDDEIIAEIRRSRFIVADFTAGLIKQEGKPLYVARGGVYFEAGFALGLGLQVMWLCRQDQVDLVHFDTRQYNHIAWSDPDDLYKRLKNRIGAVVGVGPLASLT